MKIAVTGASGFVGQAVTEKLQDGGIEVIPVSRSNTDYSVESLADVIRGAVGDAPTLPADYAELERRLAACSSEREKIGLAYRMMVACLVSRNLGVSLSDTPREIAIALVSRGIGSDADALSSAFEAAVYAPPSDQTDAPSLAPLLSRILSIIRVYLP